MIYPWILLVLVGTSYAFHLCKPGNPLAAGPSSCCKPGLLPHPSLRASADHGIVDKSTSTVFDQSLLIAGTTIGGGFLALPRATSPGGFLPSAVGLVASWLYLLSAATALADATIAVSEIEGEANCGGGSPTVSVFRVAHFVLGSRAATCVGATFGVLAISTLVAQLSKSGALLADCMPPALTAFVGGARGFTFAFALVMAAVTWAGGAVFAERTNNALTALMLASFASMAIFAARVGVPSRLLRANWPSLLPLPLGRPSSTGGQVAWAVPVLLQLLVYSECVPYVTRRLGCDRNKVRRALAFGSFIPLCMCLLWAAAAIAVMPYASPDGTTAVLSAALSDPVARLLAASGGADLRLLQGSILLLAGSAISTTVIGSLLTTMQFLQDVARVPPDTLPATGHTIRLRLGLRIVALAPCTLIAAFGGRGLYYAATAFAGAFPVVLLWGLFPAVAYYRMRSHLPKEEADAHFSSPFPLINIVFSAAMLLVNVINVYFR